MKKRKNKRAGMKYLGTEPNALLYIGILVT